MISNELLNKKILDEAIHGRLIENDTSLPPVDVEEMKKDIPFGIPNNWKWTTLKIICNIITGKKDADFGDDKGEYDFFTCALESIKCNSYSYEGEYLICPGNGANVGKTIYYDGKFEAYQRTYLISIKPLYNIKLKYLYYYFLRCWEEYNTGKMYGSAIPYIRLGNLENFQIPIPPIEEQEKIVKKIEELFELIDKKEKNDQEKEKLKTLLKEKILDSAIHGEIVENDLSLPIVDVEEAKENVPFEIPNNWKWSKLGRISDYGKNKKVKGINISKDEWILELEDIEKNTGKILNKIYQADRNAISDKNVFFKGNLLYGKLRPYLNKCVIADEDGFCCTEIEPIILNSNIEAKYIQRVLMSKYFLNYVTSCSYGAKMPRLGTKDAKNAMIPIPPLEQQKKIVEKIEKCFELIEQL